MIPTTCPGCGLVTEADPPVDTTDLFDDDEMDALAAHGEAILRFGFEALRDFVKGHPRTPMSIPDLANALRMAGWADLDVQELRTAVLHAHQAGAIFVYRHWFSRPHIPQSGRPPIGVTDRWYRDLMVWADPPKALMAQNGDAA